MPAIPLKDLSYRHEGILNWMLMNPDKSQGECARALNYTEAWLSTAVNSDIFRMRLAMLQQENREHGIFTLTEQLSGLASQAIEKTARNVEVSADPGFVLSAAEIALKRLGFGPKAIPPAPPQVVNNTLIVATQAGLVEAVGIMRSVKAQTAASLEHDDQDRSGTLSRRPIDVEAMQT